MAISAPVTLTSGGGSAAASFTTASVTPVANRLYLLSVMTYVTTTSIQPLPPTISGNGMTWVQVGTDCLVDTSGTDRATLFLFRSMKATAPTAGTITITPSASMKCTWILDEINGVPTTGANGADAVTANVVVTPTMAATALTLSATLGTFASSSNAGYFAYGAESTEARTVVAPWLLKTSVLTTTICANVTGYILGNASLTATVNWTTTATRAGIIAIELSSGSGAPGAQTFSPTAITAPGGGGGSSSPIRLMGSGDIAASGTDAQANAMSTGNLIRAAQAAGTVEYVTVWGDLAYDDGLLSEFTGNYDPTWGSFKNITWPGPGNHEYNISITPYVTWWTSSSYRGVSRQVANTTDGGLYYGWDIGNGWRGYSLNSDVSMASGSAQYNWLSADLDSLPANTHIFAYWHDPRYTRSSPYHSDNTSAAAIWALLMTHGADIVCGGHNHMLNRFVRMNGSGSTDPAGIMQFVAGAGGDWTYEFSSAEISSPHTGIAWSNNTDFGVVKFYLYGAGANQNTFAWEFIASGNGFDTVSHVSQPGTVAAGTIIDTGTSATNRTMVYAGGGDAFGTPTKTFGAPTQNFTGSLPLTGSGSLTASGVAVIGNNRTGTLPLTGSGSLTASGVAVIIGGGGGAGYPKRLLSFSDVQFDGGSGTTTRATATGAMLDAETWDVVTFSGDHTNDATTAEFNQFGSVFANQKPDIYAIPGNHDWDRDGGGNFIGFYNNPNQTGTLSAPWHSHDLGGWHLIFLGEAAGWYSLASGSTQYNWLAADLAANVGKPTFVFNHWARYCAGSSHGSNSGSSAAFALCISYGVEAFIGGHEHLYNRFARMNNSGGVDSVNGIRQFVNGPCGQTGSMTNNTSMTGLEAYGTYSQICAIRFTLGTTSYSWETITPSGYSAIGDSGTQSIRFPISGGGGGTQVFGPLPLTGSGSLSATGVAAIGNDRTGTLARTGSGTLTTSGVATIGSARFGSMPLTGSGTLTASGVAVIPTTSVLIGAGGAYLGLTTDGTTWSANRLFLMVPAWSGDVYDVCYNSTAQTFVCVGSSSQSALSTDGGYTWTAYDLGFGSDHALGVAWSPVANLFVAVGAAGKLATSPTGVTWTLRTSSFGADLISGVDYGAGYFVATGDNAKIATSSDGINWTPRTSGFAAGQAVNAATYSPSLNTWVIVGNNGGIATAIGANPTSFTLRTSALYGDIRDVTWSDAEAKFFTPSILGGVQYSTDGVTWYQPGFTNSWGSYSVQAADEWGKVYLGHEFGEIYETTTGSTWVLNTTLPTSVNAMAYGVMQSIAVVAPTGIVSAEAFGTPVAPPGLQTITPTGLASAEAFGTPVEVAPPGPQTITPTGLASAEVFGTPVEVPQSGTPQTISPTGVASAQAVGTPAKYFNNAPTATLHYVSNEGGEYTLTAPLGFTVHDTSYQNVGSIPTGHKAMVWVGIDKVGSMPTTEFYDFVDANRSNANIYGYYLIDEPNSSASQIPCRAASDYIHGVSNSANIALGHVPSGGNPNNHKSMILLTDWRPPYADVDTYVAYNKANAHTDLIALDPYPVLTNGSYATGLIASEVTLCKNAGTAQADIVPVFQAFGGWGFGDPTDAQFHQILLDWDAIVPNPILDYAYSWSTQGGLLDDALGLRDTADGTSGYGSWQAQILAHNAATTTQGKTAAPIASEEAFGTPIKLAPASAVTKYPVGILSAEVFGSPTAPGTVITRPRHFVDNEGGAYITTGALGYDIHDITMADIAAINALPAGHQAMVWVGVNVADGLSAAFQSFVTTQASNSKIYGYYLAENPYDASTVALVQSHCSYIHANGGSGALSKKAFATLNFSSVGGGIPAVGPLFAAGAGTGGSTLDLVGITPLYAVLFNGQLQLDVATAQYNLARAYVPQANLVPMFQVFGGTDFAPGSPAGYELGAPDDFQLQQILAHWDSLIPTPTMDYSHSWGNQGGLLTTCLGQLSPVEPAASWRTRMAAHNAGPVPSLATPTGIATSVAFGWPIYLLPASNRSYAPTAIVSAGAFGITVVLAGATAQLVQPTSIVTPLSMGHPVANLSSLPQVGTFWTVAVGQDAVTGGFLGRAWGNTTRVHEMVLPFDPSELYRVTARIRQVPDIEASGTYVGIRAYMAAPNGEIGASLGDVYVCCNNISPQGDWLDYVGYFRGVSAVAGPHPDNPIQWVPSWDPEFPTMLHQSTRYLRPLVIAGSGDTAYTEFDLMKIEVVPPGFIDTQHIGTAAITSALIGDGQIITAHINDLTVTSAKIASIEANKITTGALQVGVEINAGPPESSHASMSHDGFHVYADDPDLDPGIPPHKVISIGTGTGDSLTIMGPNNRAVASIGPDGAGSFTSLEAGDGAGPKYIYDSAGNKNLTSGVVIYGEEFHELVDKHAIGAVGSGFYGAEWGPYGLGGTELGVGEIAFMQMPGRGYKITFNGFDVMATDATTHVVTRLRYEVGGATPSIYSHVMDAVFTLIGQASVAITTQPMMVLAAFGTEQQRKDNPDGLVVRVIVTIARIYGSGTYSIGTHYGHDYYKPIRLFVEDAGMDVPDIWVGNNGSGGNTTVKRTYVTSYKNVSSATYSGKITSGATNPGDQRFVSTGEVIQGYSAEVANPSSVQYGDQQGLYMWNFNEIWSALQGARITKVEVYLTATYWPNPDGAGTAIISPHMYDTLPFSDPADWVQEGYHYQLPGQWPAGTGRWITLSEYADGWDYSKWNTGATPLRGIRVGPTWNNPPEALIGPSGTTADGWWMWYSARFAGGPGSATLRFTWVR